MEANDLKSLYAEVTQKMHATVEHVRHELAGVRTGRASVSILDSVHIEAYGTMMPLNQVASLSVPEPTLIVAQPFDPGLMGTIEKAIRKTETECFLALSNEQSLEIIAAVDRGVKRWGAGARPAIVTRPEIRRFLKKLWDGDIL